MNKLMLIAALGLVLGTNIASAATPSSVLDQTDAASRPVSARGQKWAELRREHAFGLGTYSASSRNVGPASSMASPVSPYGSAISGLPTVPGAPGASNVNGGN